MPHRTDRSRADITEVGRRSDGRNCPVFSRDDRRVYVAAFAEGFIWSLKRHRSRGRDLLESAQNRFLGGPDDPYHLCHPTSADVLKLSSEFPHATPPD